MKLEDFKKLHKQLSVVLSKTLEFNPIDSATDPTQDIPVKAIQMTASGLPLNVKQIGTPMSGVRIEQFTAIERRNMDKFDVLGDYQRAAGRVAGAGTEII